MSVHWTHCSLTGASAAWLIPHGCLALLIPAAGLFNVASIDSPSASQGLPALTARRPPPTPVQGTSCTTTRSRPRCSEGELPCHPSRASLPARCCRAKTVQAAPTCMQLVYGASPCSGKRCYSLGLPARISHYLSDRLGACRIPATLLLLHGTSGSFWRPLDPRETLSLSPQHTIVSRVSLARHE